MQLVKLSDSQWLITDSKYQNLVSKEWFDINHWQRQDAVAGQSVGRGITYFFKHQKKPYVLRQYRRGGLIGKFIKKSYWFKDLESTRAFQELNVLKQLRQLKLPAPKPVAALVQVQGSRYQAQIITRRIKKAQDLFHYLQSDGLSEQQWQQVGFMIKQFHQHGLYHSDLNIHNIMLNKKGNFWLIDFDKARFVPPMASELGANLDRLLRSLRKEKAKLDSFHWQEQDWAHLLQGYATENS
ncbi:MAG: 3-deoxy-D-manno-octulosonic acid kinase [Gammaproteobacteria bacterium]|nr:3-deoxy-D-manno-octulosonic acid kinase [Gammaproteobacteria bacterium]